jgi:hypothetical protein
LKAGHPITHLYTSSLLMATSTKLRGRFYHV